MIDKSLSVVVPCFNESSRGDFTARLTSVYDYLRANVSVFELVLVNDGSTDSTAQDIILFSDRKPEVKVVSYPYNEGKGFAVRRGILECTSEYILYMDADLSVDLKHISDFLSAIEPYECIIASRRIKGASVSVDQSRVRRAVGKVCRGIVNAMFHFSILDTQCGFKMFYGEDLLCAAGIQKINRWMFDVEYLYMQKLRGVEIQEHPVSWSNTNKSSVTGLKALLGSVSELCKVRLGRRAYARYIAEYVPYDTDGLDESYLPESVWIDREIYESIGKRRAGAELC